MAESAEVLSLDVLVDFRVALIRFAEDGRIAMQDVEFAIRRTTEWLSNHQRLYWQSEIRRWQQKLAQAKTELHRKKLARFSDRRPDTTQEEKAVRLAQARLENAERKLQRVKSWVPELQRAVQEYHSQAQALADNLEMGLARDIAQLGRMIEALEQYAALRAPTAPNAPGAGRSGPASEGMGRGEVAPEEPGRAEPDEAPAPDGIGDAREPRHERLGQGETGGDDGS